MKADPSLAAAPSSVDAVGAASFKVCCRVVKVRPPLLVKFFEAAACPFFVAGLV
jgi:hypothetical protein